MDEILTKNIAEALVRASKLSEKTSNQEIRELAWICGRTLNSLALAMGGLADVQKLSLDPGFRDTPPTPE